MAVIEIEIKNTGIGAGFRREDQISFQVPESNLPVRKIFQIQGCSSGERSQLGETGLQAILAQNMTATIVKSCRENTSKRKRRPLFQP